MSASLLQLLLALLLLSLLLLLLLQYAQIPLAIVLALPCFVD